METSLATEFPADNPLLDSGSAWVCSSLRGRALPTRRRMILVTPILLMPEGSVPPPHSVPVPVPVLAASARAPAPPPSEPFENFVRALVESLPVSAQGRAATVLPALFDAGCLNSAELGAEALQAMRQRGIIEPDSLLVTGVFRARAEAWRGVLCGTSDDLSACGDTTLDGWSSELLCAFSAAPIARAGEYRRELRKRGVAAFGVL